MHLLDFTRLCHCRWNLITERSQQQNGCKCCKLYSWSSLIGFGSESVCLLRTRSCIYNALVRHGGFTLLYKGNTVGALSGKGGGRAADHWMRVIWAFTLLLFHQIMRRKKKEKKIWNRMTASVLKQDPNTKRFKRMLIYFNTDTQYANLRGNSLYQATKRHLNNR